MDNTSNSIKVIVADDHPLFRKAISSVLTNFSFIKKIEPAANGEEVLQLLKGDLFNLIFLDIEMPVMNGIEAATRVREQYPNVLMIAVSMVDDLYTISKMYQAGCSGYIIKHADEEEILEAITRVMDGKKYFPPGVLEKLAFEKDEEIINRLHEIIQLKPVELRIIRLICAEKKNKEIADELGLSDRTIETYRQRIYGKANVNSSIGLMLFAQKHKIIDTLKTS